MSDTDNNSEPEQQNPFHSNDEENEEEFSLDQLSQAYAKVLQENQGDVRSPATDDQGNGEESPEIDEPEIEPELQADDEESDDLLDDKPCAVSPESILEAVLFVGTPQGESLTAKKIAALMRDVSPKEIKELVKGLNVKYAEEGAAYRVTQEKSSYRLELAPEFDKVKEKFYGEIRIAKLSQPAVDVLAVVAYHQPISREKVDKIRIRPSGSILNQLVRRQLLDFQMTETKPKQKRYITTDRFLELFGLESLDDLPQSHEVGTLDDLAD